MRSLKTLVLAGAVFAGATAVASASDLGPPPLRGGAIHGGPIHGGLPAAPISEAIAETSGWYLRGDIGVAHQNFKPQLEDKRFPLRPIVNQYDLDLSKVGYVGIGAGYQVNSWLRADLTAEYRLQQNFKFEDKSCFGNVGGTWTPAVVGPPAVAGFLAGGTAVAAPGAACATRVGFTGQDNRNFYDGNLRSTVFLANAYVDLGNWGGLSPFLGAGAGFARHTFANVTDVGASDNFGPDTLRPGLAPGAYRDTSSSNLVKFSNVSKTNFAWAIMAGVGYDVSPSTKLEFGYRYLNMGKVKQNILNCTGGPGVAGTCGDFLHYNNIHSHEFKVGMRWMLGGTSYAAAPVHAPYPAEPPRMIKKF